MGRLFSGQGATEYLVLLAVVLIIALVGVALLGFFPGTAADAQEQESRIYWQSASPIAITEWAARYANDSVPPGYTHVYLRIRNIGQYPIRLMKVLANGKSSSTLYTGSWGPATTLGNRGYLGPGEERAFLYPQYFGLPYPGSGNAAFFVFEYESTTKGSLSSNCSRTAPFGTAVINNFGFEYIQYVEGQEITKRQIGAKPVIIECMSNYD